MTYELAKELKDAEKYDKAKRNPRWKGQTALYQTKHQFLARNFGNPPSCEHCEAEGVYEWSGRWSIQWAKKQGADYTHVRSDYLGLCRSCHRKYDMTPKEKARLQALSRNQTPEQLAKLSVKRRAIALARPRKPNGAFA